MITDSNRACSTKMIGRRVQKDVNEISPLPIFKNEPWGRNNEYQSIIGNHIKQSKIAG